jgi:hypothetical protein
MPFFFFKSFIFFVLQNQRTGEWKRFGAGSGREIGTGVREVVGKVGSRMNTMQTMCTNKYVNTKMIPVETVPGIGRRGWRTAEVVNSNMIYLIHCKNLRKFYNEPHPTQK